MDKYRDVTSDGGPAPEPFGYIRRASADAYSRDELGIRCNIVKTKIHADCVALFAAPVTEPAPAQDEREARDWEMKAKGIESVIHLVVSKHDQEVLRQYAEDMRTEGKRLASRPAQAAQQPEQSQAITDLLAERRRQIEAEGWTLDHDDEHDPGVLASAASAYALLVADELHPHSQGDGNYREDPHCCWPWDMKWWKPGDSRRNLIKAGALILAEIERLDRAAQGGE